MSKDSTIFPQTDTERQIWAAVYASAFVSSFNDVMRREGVSKALDTDHATDSCCVADEAIEQLRKVEQ